MNEESAPERRPPGRLVQAWRVLFGRSVTSEQLQWEWAEYKQAFNDLLQRYSAQLARAARAEKKRIARLMEAQDEPFRQPPPSSPQDRKAQLRRRAAELQGLSPPPSSSEPTREGPPLPDRPSPRQVRPPSQGSLALVQEEEENP